MNYRKGDIVSVLATVKHDADDSKERLFLDVNGSHETLWLKPHEVTLVAPNFQVGDGVIWEDGLGEILAISGDHAWIEYGNGNYCTRMLGSIKRSASQPEGEVDAT